MLFERIVSEGIAHNSYIIGAGGKAAVVDPRRDCEIYIEIAEQNNCAITHIFETHRNEDYVIGSLELASRTDATIYHGAALPFAYGTPARNGDTFSLGSLEISVLETPGHTEESISLVVKNRSVSDFPFMVFCGDTLFASDIARTDFYGQEKKAEMAGKIWDSISHKILSLGDGVIICPAHGAGSICGGEIADIPYTTAGYEKQTNRLLGLGRDSFIIRRLHESPYVPPYFRQMEKYNKEGAPVFHHLPLLRPVPVQEMNELIKTGCQIVDIRSPTGFAAGHIPGSISIWRDGLAAFIGWFLDYDRPIVIVDDFNCCLQDLTRTFFRLGYDNITGYLAGGFPAWSKAAQPTSAISTCTVQQLKTLLDKDSLFLVDVRDIKNWNTIGHIRGAYHCYVGELPMHLAEIPKNEPLYIYCDAGFKGGLAASILEANNFHGLTNVLGGMTAWKSAGYRIDK